ncbi:M23 family metallopeptidase [Jatrophihabitans sp. DSM 45814]
MRFIRSAKRSTGGSSGRRSMGRLSILALISFLAVEGTLVLNLPALAQPAVLVPAEDVVGRMAVSGSLTSYQPPVRGVLSVLTRFAAPLDRYAAGHLGVDLGDADGSVVLSAGAGTVRFAGIVAGRGVIVVAHRDDISTEYEPVATLVRVGQRVGAGQLMGHISGRHASCAPVSCLHWGARRGSAYLDPLSLLGPLGIVRLLPNTGSIPGNNTRSG